MHLKATKDPLSVLLIGMNECNRLSEREKDEEKMNDEWNEMMSLLISSLTC